MAEARLISHEAIGEELELSAVSWAAVFAGAVVASALSLTLIALGSGLGFVSISPWAGNGVSATTFGALAVAWFAAIQLFAPGVGGYIAGRLRTRWVGAHTDEVFFRDTAHGLLVWAAGTIVAAGLLASGAASVLSGAAQAGGAVLQGTGSAVSAIAGSAANKPDATGYFTDMLFRADPSRTPGDAGASRAEVGRIFARSIAEGDLNTADQSYVAQVVAHQTGLSQPDAEKRVADVVGQAKAAATQVADKARAAADEARKIAVYASLWAFASLLLGAFSASYMATVGGRVRDDLPAAG